MNEKTLQEKLDLLRQAADEFHKNRDLPGLFATVQEDSNTPLSERIARQNLFDANRRAGNNLDQQRQNERTDTTGETRFGAAGRGQGQQEGRPREAVRIGARRLEDAVIRADSEAGQVRGESESRQSSDAAKQSQDAALIGAAAKEGLILDHADFLRRWRESGGTKGAEHLVVFNGGDGFVEKRTNIPLFHKNWSDYFIIIKIHNIFFPETAISIEGVHDQKVKAHSSQTVFLNELNAEDIIDSNELDVIAMFGGRANYVDPRRAGAYVVTSQPYVKINPTPLSQEQISYFLEEANFFKLPSHRHLEYYNPKVKVFLQDAHDGNIVSRIDAAGAEKIFLIDTPFRFATEGDAATIRAFNGLMRGKLINGRISQERYRKLKPFLTDPEVPGGLDSVRPSLLSA